MFRSRCWIVEQRPEKGTNGRYGTGQSDLEELFVWLQWSSKACFNCNFDSEAWSFEIDVWRLSRAATETHLANQTPNWTQKSESVKDPSYLPKVHPHILTANAVVRGVLMRFRVYNLRFKVQLDCTFCAQPFLHCQLRSTACKSEYFAEVYTIKLATIQLKPLFVNINSTSPRLCRVLDLARWPN